MKTSAGAPASICFASALLAPYDTTTLLPVAGLEPSRLLVHRLLEARCGEHSDFGGRGGHREQRAEHDPKRHRRTNRVTVPQDRRHSNISPYITVGAKKAPRAAGASA